MDRAFEVPEGTKKMKLNSVITDWNMRDQIKKGMDLREDLRTPISKRKIVKPSRSDPYEVNFRISYINLGEGCYQKKNAK